MVKNPPANAGDAGDVGLIPGLGRSPGGRNGNPVLEEEIPLQCSCLENLIDRKACGGGGGGGLQSMGSQRVG